MILSKGIIKADIIAARQAIAYFDEKQLRDIKNVAAYHLQQAAEKLIKLQIYTHCGNAGNRQLYTHNSEHLIAYADSLDFGVIIPEFIREQSLQITEWEVGSRYDIRFSVRIDMLRKILAVMTEWESRIQ